MDVYRQAAAIVEQVGKGQGTAKSLCLQKQVQKKKQTYAVVCETTRNLERIKKVLADAQFFEYYPHLAKMDGMEQGSLDQHQHQKQQAKVRFDPKFLIYCMTYDHLYGKGINTRQHPAVKALMESKDALFKIDAQLPKIVPRSLGEKIADEEAFAAEEAAQQNENNTSNNNNNNSNNVNPFGIAYSFPRYARINRLMYDGNNNNNNNNNANVHRNYNMTNEEILSRLQNQNFRRSGVAIRRERNDEIDRKNQEISVLNQKHQQQRNGKQQNTGDDNDGEQDEDDEMKIIDNKKILKGENGNDDDDGDENEEAAVDVEANVQKPKMDQHIPGLIVFPPGTDIHAHPLVKQGKLLLQDKASCLPAAVLCDLVPNDFTKQIPAEGFGLLVDGCSAPGNKTSQLVEYTAASNYYQNISTTKTENKNDNNEEGDDAAVPVAPVSTGSRTQVVAVERDASRFKLLQQRMQQLTGGNVACRRGSFEEVFEQGECENVGAILLDPSCSSSGVLSRIDQQMKKTSAGNAENGSDGQINNNNNGAETEKVKQLAQDQLALVIHALTAFPNCKRVVYSTCSINQEENENVVLAAFAAFLKHHEGLGKKKQRRQGKWRVTCIMPEGMWKTRGRFVEGEMSEEQKASLPFSKEERDQIASCCIRCDPFADKTSGFFVARFDRIPRED